jgi:transcriptional regulator with XRE-family HTH domain
VAVSVEALVEQVPVDVGRRVRDARAERGWTLDQLADHSGVSRRMIVNVESGTANASIATLLRLATALHVSLADLVAEAQPSAPVVVRRASEHEALWRGPSGGTAVLVTSADTPDVLELWDWTLAPGEVFASEAHRPGTRELLHVLAGRLTVTVDGVEQQLGAGDAASFMADVPHSYASGGRRSVRFVMTVLEPLTRVRP